MNFTKAKRQAAAKFIITGEQINDLIHSERLIDQNEAMLLALPLAKDPPVLVAVWARDGAEYMMRVELHFAPNENGTSVVLHIPDDYLDVRKKHGPPDRWERKPLSEYGVMYTSGDACEFFSATGTPENTHIPEEYREQLSALGYE